MTLSEIANTLPNGFHDAEISQLNIDYVSNTATFELELWLGDMDSPDDSGRERYRRAKLILDGVAYLAVDAPDSGDFSEGPRPICIDFCDASTTHTIRALGPAEFAGKFFVREWNSFITFIASDAELIWLADAYDRK